MIPTKLTLRNFMCYREPVAVDFATVRVACIAGENGAGKSALLDAITWALWGKARTNTERDLISLGETQMSVDYQFLLGHQEYRVLRSRRRRGASADVPQLDVQVRDHTPDGDTPWRPISADTLSQTQQLLTRIIGMDYDTFINSAFILQGRADEFTTRGPAERKQVLADILGLARYDELEERARALRREREHALREADREVARIDLELARRAEYEADLADVSARLIAAQAETERQSEALAGLRARRNELESREQQAREAEARRDQHAREADELDARIATLNLRVARLEAVMADAAAIRAGYAELAAARARETALNGALSQLNDLQRRHRAVEKQLDSARGLLLQEQHAIDHQLTELRARQGQLATLEQQHAALQQHLAALGEKAERRSLLIESVTSATEEMGRHKADNEHLRREMQRLKALQTQIDAAGAQCPVCRRPLGEDERRHVHDDYQAEGKELADRYRDNKDRVAALERELAGYNRELREIEQALRQRDALATQAGRTERQLTEARAAGELLAVKSTDRERIATILEQRDFAPAAHADLADLDAAIAALAYDAGEHQQVRLCVARLEPFAQRLRDLEDAERSIADVRERLADDAAALARRRAEQVAEAERAAALRAGLADLPALVAQFEDAAFALDRAQREYNDLTSRQGALVGLLQRLADLEEEGRRLRGERRRLAEEEGIYRQLMEAFGKRGIQAMIIEGAVPELEDEANAILANMPGNGMRVEFRTQRETQKGDTVEALDIVIADEAGQRNYVMYSGGESFRVNFAIRVALSKLLARRAGAKLQTLVIDEGFGTQDARGRDGLVEAIRSIEADFQTILVITHINELKEAFPTQILVEKTPAGSQVMVA